MNYLVLMRMQISMKSKLNFMKRLDNYTQIKGLMIWEKMRLLVNIYFIKINLINQQLERDFHCIVTLSTCHCDILFFKIVGKYFNSVCIDCRDIFSEIYKEY